MDKFDAPKPCPFCGNKMVVVGEIFVRHHGETYEKCPLIGLRMQLEGWNIRDQDSSSRSEIERLNKVVEGLRVAINRLPWPSRESIDSREFAKRFSELKDLAAEKPAGTED